MADLNTSATFDSIHKNPGKFQVGNCNYYLLNNILASNLYPAFLRNMIKLRVNFLCCIVKNLSWFIWERWELYRHFNISCDHVLNCVSGCFCGKDNYIYKLEENLTALDETMEDLKARRDDE